MKDINHIIERMRYYCDAIASDIVCFGDGYEAFEADAAYQRSCDMSILQIGELLRHIPDEFKQKYSSVPWKEIRGLRNYIAHEYDTINLKEQWKTISEDVPNLTAVCDVILEEMETDRQIADALAYVNQLDTPTAAQALRQDAAPCVSDEPEL